MTALTIAIPDEALAQLAERVAEVVLDRVGTGERTVWLTVEQAADYLQTTGDSIRALVKRRKIRTTAQGRLLFERGELDAWVRGNQP